METFLDWGLSDQETYLIGSIITEWAAVEHEIFNQALQSFEDESTTVPRALRSPQFTNVLKVWKERIVDTATEHSDVLMKQYEEIDKLKDHRNALAHGMWIWNPSSIDRIISLRVKRDTLISAHFTIEDLQDFRTRTQRINFNIRYPGGKDDFISRRVNVGYSASRSFFKMATANAEQGSAGNPLPAE